MNNIPFNKIVEQSTVKKGFFSKITKSDLELHFNYNNSFYWIFYIAKSPDKTIKDQYILCEDNGIIIYVSNTLQQLYEQGKICNEPLKKIWNEIEIISINDCNPAEYYSIINHS